MQYYKIFLKTVHGKYQVMNPSRDLTELSEVKRKKINLESLSPKRSNSVKNVMADLKEIKSIKSRIHNTSHVPSSNRAFTRYTFSRSTLYNLGAGARIL